MVVIMIGREAQDARIIDRFHRLLPLVAFHFERDVDHHNRVLLHQPDQQDDADHPDHIELVVGQQQCQQGSYASRRDGGKNRDGMDVALVKHAQHDVDRAQRGEDQNQHVGTRILKSGRGSLKASLDRRWKADRALSFLNGASVAWPSETPGARLNEIVTEGTCPW